MKNLLTDISGRPRRSCRRWPCWRSGVTAVVFDRPAGGGDRRARRTGPVPAKAALLDVRPTPLERIDAIRASGRPARRSGLEAGGGVQCLARPNRGRGFAVRGAGDSDPCPGAICFDLLNGGNKAWGPLRGPYPRPLGYRAGRRGRCELRARQRRRRASAPPPQISRAENRIGIGRGHPMASRVAAHRGGQCGRHRPRSATGHGFWAAPFEIDGEYGRGGGSPAVVHAGHAGDADIKGGAMPRHRLRTPRWRVGGDRRRPDQARRPGGSP